MMTEWTKLEIKVITFDEIMEEVSLAAASCGSGTGGYGSCCSTDEWYGWW